MCDKINANFRITTMALLHAFQDFTTEVGTTEDSIEDENASAIIRMKYYTIEYLQEAWLGEGRQLM